MRKKQLKPIHEIAQKWKQIIQKKSMIFKNYMYNIEASALQKQQQIA